MTVRKIHVITSFMITRKYSGVFDSVSLFTDCRVHTIPPSRTREVDGSDTGVPCWSRSQSFVVSERIPSLRLLGEAPELKGPKTGTTSYGSGVSSLGEKSSKVQCPKIPRKERTQRQRVGLPHTLLCSRMGPDLAQ